MRKRMFLLVALISFSGLSFAQAPLQNASTDDLLEKLTPQPAQKTRSLSRNLVPEAQVKAEKP